jgi:hypothetical protein
MVAALMALLLAAGETQAAPAPTEASFVVGPRQTPEQPAPAKARRERPWLELDAGPLFLHRDGASGLASGPAVRFAVGMPLGERVAAELWAAGTLQSLPRNQLGDAGMAGGGIGARLLVYRFDADNRFQLFGRAGAGYMAATTQGAPNGLAAFGGLMFMIQPPVKRFAFGLEVDAMTVGNALGFAILPTLRCGL